MPTTERLTRAAAPRVPEASAERVFAELRRLIVAPRVARGLELADRLGLLRAVLPELARPPRRGAEPLPPHGRVRPHAGGARAADRAGATAGASLRRPRRAARGARRAARGRARRAARRSASARSCTTSASRPRAASAPDGRVTFIGHDELGEDMVRELCRRLRTSERLQPVPRRRSPAPPRARLPGARAPARPPRGLPLPDPHASRSRSRSRCSPAPTGSPRAARTPRRRSTRTSSWRAS